MTLLDHWELHILSAHKPTCSKGYATYVWKSLTVSHHLPMFGSHWFIGRGDITCLIRHMTSPDHMIE